jgi:hypothetical protein
MICRGGEVEDGFRLLAVVTMACSASSRSFWNSGYGWVEVPNSGGTPARNCVLLGALIKRKKMWGGEVLQDERDRRTRGCWGRTKYPYWARTRAPMAAAASDFGEQLAQTSGAI